MSLSYAALDSPQVGDKPAEHLLILGDKGELIAHAGKAGEAHLLACLMRTDSPRITSL
jgi:hypothetical protein